MSKRQTGKKKCKMARVLKKVSRRQPQKRSVPKAMKKLTITISYYDERPSSGVCISPRGELIEEIFQEGEAAWTNIKGAIHALIYEMGPLGPGRSVMIKSDP